MVFPTPVGVFPPLGGGLGGGGRLPHARGGVSLCSYGTEYQFWSSPRPSGCFSSSIAVLLVLFVFPTPVGVFLLYRAWI